MEAFAGKKMKNLFFLYFKLLYCIFHLYFNLCFSFVIIQGPIEATWQDMPRSFVVTAAADNFQRR